MSLEIQAFSKEIEKVFKSLIKSGRPDILDEDNLSLVPKLYTDLFENDYILSQVLDDNHTLLKGRRGTGKSTIFLKAEYELRNNPTCISVYINLQRCYEEVRSYQDEKNNIMTWYMTYRNFLNAILKNIKTKIESRMDTTEISSLFKDIEDGKYIDRDFERKISVTVTKAEDHKKGFGGKVSVTDFSLHGDLSNGQNSVTKLETDRTELRLFSIIDILNKITEICKLGGISKVWLFLDDFSELDLEGQKVVIDSLVAPIVSSYNENFVVKIAAYPSRIYLGNIDKSKLPSYSLDFYDAYDQGSNTYNEMEKLAISYIKRALEKRLEHYTDGQLFIDDLFEIDKDNKLPDYLQKLFYCSVGILRSLGFILSYSYLSSINNGIKISQNHIDNAAQKYYQENILGDFINDVRFKQSFYDDKVLLDQIAQKSLHDKIIENQFNLKRDVIDKYSKNTLTNKLFIETLEQNKKNTVFYFPTSHFSVDIESERLLKTLELHFIVNKYNQVSARWAPGKEISIYGLNYGLCKRHGIDFGRPAFRRTYDYWRNQDFYITDFIHEVLTSIEKIKCEHCGEEYNEEEFVIYLKRENCFNCGRKGTVKKINKFGSKMHEKIKKWQDNKIPDACMDILRVLYSNIGSQMSAAEIASEIDKYHIVVTTSMNRILIPREYVEVKERTKRYYKISDKAISIYFSDEVETFA